MAHEELDHEVKRYKKVQEYLLTLSDDELDSIGHAFQDESFERISTTEIVQKLIKISPKALLKLGKFI
jgi:digeranylgeranylglycerophospholipid reductase